MVPVLVTEGVGPITALKRSSGILRRTWGESLAGSGGLGLISFLFALPLFALVAVGGLLVRSTGTAVSGAAAGTVGAVAVVSLLALVVVFTALGSIFRARCTSTPPPASRPATWTRPCCRPRSGAREPPAITGR